MRIYFRILLAVMTAIIVLTTSHSCQDGNLPDEPGDNNQETEQEGNGTEKPEEENCYTIVDSENTQWEGEYLISYKGEHEGNKVVYVFANWAEETFGQPVFSGTEILDFSELENDGKFPADAMDQYNSTITKTGEHYSINVSNVGYIGYTGSGNTLSKKETAPSASETEYLWKIDYQEGNIVVKNAKVSERQLQWNDLHPRFAAYKGNQKDITLYRKGKGTTSPTPKPEPNPDPNPDPNPNPEPNPNPNPEPNPNPNPNPDVNHTGSGWFELPVIDDADNNGISDSDKTLYYASHICAGGEKYGHNGQPARNYTVCFSSEHHCPVWVAAPRHKMYEHGANRTNAYAKDPKIPADIQYHSKSTGGGCNKGHMLGSAERLSTTATNKQVFYYSNIAPQLSGSFNTGGGAWNNLEDKVDTYVCTDTLYEVIGCYFKKYTDKYNQTCEPKKISYGGRSDVTRPSMFYYVLLRTKSGNSGKPVTQCSANELKCVAFVLRHNMEKGHKPQESDMMSVSDLEKITGFKYFTNVPNAPKDTFNPSDWGI